MKGQSMLIKSISAAFYSTAFLVVAYFSIPWLFSHHNKAILAYYHFVSNSSWGGYFSWACVVAGIFAIFANIMYCHHSKNLELHKWELWIAFAINLFIAYLLAPGIYIMTSSFAGLGLLYGIATYMLFTCWSVRLPKGSDVMRDINRRIE